MGADRHRLLGRLEDAGRKELVTALRSAELEHYYVSPLWLVRRIYEERPDVRQAFLRADPAAAAAFVPNRPGHWLLDLYGAARARLHRVGITAISGGTHCTLTEADRFYSHRRDAQTGRQATLIWLLREQARSKGTGP